MVADMPLQQDGGSPAEPGRFSVSGCLQSRRGASQNRKLQFTLNDGPEPRPSGCNFARDQNKFRREGRSNEPESAADCVGLPRNGFNRKRVVLFGEAQKAVDI